jgi:hypothetical protein
VKIKYSTLIFLLILILLDPVCPKLKQTTSHGKYLGQEPPGIAPVVFAPGWISTVDNIEFAATFSPDFKEYLFTRKKKDTIDNRIYQVRWENGGWKGPEADGPWETIAPHLHGPFMHPCVGPDESLIIFDTEQSMGGRGKSLLISFRSEDGSWGNIISFRELEQFQHFGQFGIPMLNPDNKYLFFSSDGDIYWVHAEVIETLGSH